MLLSEFSKFILPEVIGCPDPMLTQALRQTAFEFFDKSGVWVEESEEVVAPDELEYDLPNIGGAIALRIRDAWINGQRMNPSTHRDASSVALSYHSSGGQVFKLGFPLSGVIRLRVVYAPSLMSTSIPDVLANRYLDTIASGTKSRLMLMPSTAWANPSLATYYASRFAAGVQEAQSDVEHDHTYGSLQVIPTRKFA